VRGQPGLQFLLGWRRLRGGILDDELELLPQPAADDRVVAIEPGGHRLARRDLLAHPFVEQALQLDVGRRTLPGLGEPGRQMVDLPCGDDDPAPRRARPAAAPVEVEEQRGADQQEVEQRFAQQRFQSHEESIVVAQVNGRPAGGGGEGADCSLRWIGESLPMLLGRSPHRRASASSASDHVIRCTKPASFTARQLRQATHLVSGRAPHESVEAAVLRCPIGKYHRQQAAAW